MKDRLEAGGADRPGPRHSARNRLLGVGNPWAGKRVGRTRGAAGGGEGVGVCPRPPGRAQASMERAGCRGGGGPPSTGWQHLSSGRASLCVYRGQQLLSDCHLHHPLLLDGGDCGSSHCTDHRAWGTSIRDPRRSLRECSCVARPGNRVWGPCLAFFPPACTHGPDVSLEVLGGGVRACPEGMRSSLNVPSRVCVH